MRIIHCADLHIDSPLSSLPKEHTHKRREELLLCFRRMVDYASENNVDAIIIAGDLYDRRKPSATAAKFIMGQISSHPDIDFYYLKGNHDSDEPYDGCVIPDNLKMFSDHWTTYSDVCKCKGQDVGEELHSGKGHITISGIELNADNRIAPGNVVELDMRNFNIVILHGDAAENSNDINLKCLYNLGIDYLALGHIHSYRYEQLDKRGVYCYPGCLESRGFDEADKHGFVVLDIDEQTHSFTSQLIDLSVRHVNRLDIDISECMDGSDILNLVRNRVYEESFSSDDMLLINLTGKVDIACDKNIHVIEQYFSNNFFMARVHDRSEYRVDYSDYALDESLKGEFVRAVYASKELSDDDKATIIRLGIRALRGEDIKV